MKLIYPTFVGHFASNKNTPVSICSIDFHPDGKRFATGGYDKRIKIWSTQFLNNKQKQSKNQVHLLASVLRHEGSVLCVRWSNLGGKYLASSADDRTILIWEKDDNSDSIQEFGEKDKNIENWKVCKRLGDHTSDVMDLAWSIDNTYLASVSLDSQLIIWKNFEKFMEIPLEAPAKGVAFDPLGEYLAAQLDNQKVYVWQIYNWKVKVELDFQTKKKQGTFFQRLSWTPTGSHLITANIMVNDSPIVSLLKRDSFEQHISFSGHTRPIEVALFNQVSFKKSGKEICYCALAGSDQTITIWSNTSARPLIATISITKSCIMDLSWSPDGYTLAACTDDGTVCFMMFDQITFGTPIIKKHPSVDKIRNSHQALLSSHKLIGVQSSDELNIIEDIYQNQSDKQLSVSNSQPSANTMDTQIGTTKIKKRIQPTLLSGNSLSVTSNINQLIHTDPVFQNGINNNTISKPIIKENKMEYNLKDANKFLTSNENDRLLNFKRFKIDDKTNNIQIKETDQTLSFKEHEKINVPPLYPFMGIKKTNIEYVKPINKIIKDKVGEKSLVILIENKILNKEYAYITCQKENKVIWKDILPSNVVLIETSNSYISVGCENGDLLIYSVSGERVLPIIHLGSPPCFLDLKEHLLLCVIACGVVYIWDLSKKQSTLSNISLAPLLSSSNLKNVKIISAKIFNHLPVIILNNGQSYTFHRQLMSWIKLNDPLFFNSNIYPTLPPQDTIDDGFLHIQQKTKLEMDSSFKMLIDNKSMDSTDRQLITISSLENDLISAEVLVSPSDYILCLERLVTHLVSYQFDSKLRRICNQLLGPPLKSSELNQEEFQFNVLGLNKRDLLKRILPIIGKNANLQSIYLEFTNLLGYIEGV